MAVEVHKEFIVIGPGRQLKWPFPTMEVGDTFYIPRKNDKNGISKNQFSLAYSLRRYWQGRLPGRKFDVHAVSVGLRVQRVE